MFQMGPEGEIFCYHQGNKVLAGAMGVDKFKEVDGEKKTKCGLMLF